MPEEWAEIKGYEGRYQVSTFGNIRSLNYANTGRAQNLKLGNHKQGYLEAHLSKNGGEKTFKVHRLVAMAFIPNPRECKEVNHIDENPRNNFVENLEWVTRSENVNHGTRNLRMASKISKPVVQLNHQGKEIRHFSSAAKTSLYGFDPSHVLKCCRGKLKKHKGFRWKYKEARTDAS